MRCSMKKRAVLRRTASTVASSQSRTATRAPLAEKAVA